MFDIYNGEITFCFIKKKFFWSNISKFQVEKYIIIFPEVYPDVAKP